MLTEGLKKMAHKTIGPALIILALLLLLAFMHIPAHAQEGYVTAPFNTQYLNQVGPITFPASVNISQVMFPGNVPVGSMPDGNLIYQAADGTYHILFFSTNYNVPYRDNGGPEPGASPSPEPSPQPSPTPVRGQGLRAQMNQMIIAAQDLVPTIRRLIEKPLMPLMMRLGWIAASFILIIAFLRLLKENNGASMEFYYWMGRAVFFLFLIGIGPYIVFFMTKVGNIFTIPLESTVNTVQVSFNEKYREFTEGHFTIKDDNQVWVPPRIDGTPGLIGILYDKDKKIKDPSEALNISSWEMPKLFALLSFSRTLVEFADLFLIIAGAFIIIALRMAAPGMLALGLDQKLAHQSTYPYAWATASFTLIFPLFRDILRILAYVIGNLALSVYDGQPMYWMDERTGEIITRAGFEPTYTIFLAAFMMMVTALSMCMAPFLAYKYLKGQIFEGISTVTSGWMASMIGSGVELYGLKAGAAISQHGQALGLEGQYRSEMTRAIGQKQAGDLGARSRQIVGTANIQGGLQAALGGIRGSQVTQQLLAATGRDFGINSTRAGVTLAQSDIEARRGQSIGGINAANSRDQHNIAGESSAEKRAMWGRSINDVGTKVSPVIEGAGSIVGVPLGIAGTLTEGTSIGIRNRTQRDAATSYATNMTGIENTASDQLGANQTAYGQTMEGNYNTQFEGTVAAVDTGAGIAAGGAQRGAATSLGGINQGYKLDMQANQTIFDSTAKGAEISRDSGMERARMEALSHVVTSFFRDVDRRIEDGLKPRY